MLAVGRPRAPGRTFYEAGGQERLRLGSQEYLFAAQRGKFAIYHLTPGTAAGVSPVPATGAIGCPARTSSSRA